MKKYFLTRLALAFAGDPAGIVFSFALGVLAAPWRRLTAVPS